jgi:hypothetical protein
VNILTFNPKMLFLKPSSKLFADLNVIYFVIYYLLV